MGERSPRRDILKAAIALHKRKQLIVYAHPDDVEAVRENTIRAGRDHIQVLTSTLVSPGEVMIVDLDEVDRSIDREWGSEAPDL